MTYCQQKNNGVLLSIFLRVGYNDFAAASKLRFGKEMIMAEFGENLKRVREEKGITQQTLADHLYVTRQAVSRWEGGSRYPDIMTAKKMSQFLGVSLDELLSDDDMKLYVEKNAILDSSVPKRAQILLIAFAFMCSLVISILYLSNLLIQHSYAIESPSETIKSILLTVVFGYSAYAALYDQLNPKITTIIFTIYLGTALLTGIVGGIWLETGSISAYLLAASALNIVFLVLCIRFFCSRKVVSPIPLYLTAGLYGIIGIVHFFLGFKMDIPIEIYRDVLMLDLFSLIQSILLLVLLVLMAYTLNQKRKLANR